MGLWEYVQQWPRGRLIAGILASILIHVLLVVAGVWGLRPQESPRWTAKKGDTIIVELPMPEEPAKIGSPAAPPPPAAPPAPPTPVVAKPLPPTPRPQPTPAREERRVASAPRAPEPAPPTATAAEPAPRVVEPAPRAAEPASPPEGEAPRVVSPAPAPARREGERQVASLPPSGPVVPSVGDVRAALRHGAGGQGEGRGGIVGDAIPLDTPDPRFREYFDQVRQRIEAKLGYPCVKSRGTFECEHKTTSLVVNFGILRSGDLQFIELYRASEWSIYDEYSMTAIRLAQPFPPVPPALMAALPSGTTGVPIAGHFRFSVYQSLRSILQ